VSLAFDHRDAGTPEVEWAACGQLSASSTVVVGPGAPGLVTTAARAGSRVEVIIASDGERSHPGSPTHTPDRLAAIRRVEAAAAVSTLAPAATVTFLGLPDGALPQHRGALVDALRSRLGEDVLLVTPWRDDQHPDHEACALAAAVAAAEAGCRHWQYPIWAWHWADPASAELPWADLRRLELQPAAREAKAAALSRYVSQHAPLSPRPGDEPILAPYVTAHFARPFETFVVPPAPAAQPVYFDDLYARSDDPWGLQDRFYEQRKRELVCAALPRPRFRRALEPGCASGLLTAGLAQRCDEVLACDVADRAVALARERLAGVEHVRVERRRIPDDWPARSFDLIVLSEVGYYCPDLAALGELVRATLTSDGVVIACHWRHPAPDHPHTADEVHAALGEGLHRVAAHIEEDFRLDVWTRGGASVARLDGILG
jgi:LmbE family N-acetylglucosaminyl deacetylase/SAM-dependent methyltransferase